MSAVLVACISDQDSLLAYRVPPLASRRTRVDRMFVVKTPANGVAFDDLDAHVESK